MKNIKKNLAIICLSLCSGFVFAQAPKPASCPAVSALQGVAMDGAISMDRTDEWSAAVFENNFGTEVNWSFGVIGIKAKTQEQAVNKARKIIPNMQLAIGPTYNEYEDAWACEYYTPKKIMGLAITPAIKFDDTIKIAKRIR